MLVPFRILMVAFALFLSSLTGCVATSARYHGNLVDEDRVVELKSGGPHKVELQTFDLMVSYEYLLDGGVLNLSGNAVLGNHYRAIYARLNSLHVYLFLVDEESRVIETSLLVNALMSQPDEKFKFNIALQIPPEATGLSLGYDGEVYEADAEPFLNTTRFSQLP